MTPTQPPPPPGVDLSDLAPAWTSVEFIIAALFTLASWVLVALLIIVVLRVLRKLLRLLFTPRGLLLLLAVLTGLVCWLATSQLPD